MEGFSYPNATSYIMSEILWGKKKNCSRNGQIHTWVYGSVLLRPRPGKEGRSWGRALPGQPWNRQREKKEEPQPRRPHGFREISEDKPFSSSAAVSASTSLASALLTRHSPLLPGKY